MSATGRTSLKYGEYSSTRIPQSPHPFGWGLYGDTWTPPFNRGWRLRSPAGPGEFLVQNHVALLKEGNGELDRTLVAAPDILRVVGEELEGRNQVTGRRGNVVLLADPADQVALSALVLEELEGQLHRSVVTLRRIQIVGPEERQVALVVVIRGGSDVALVTDGAGVVGVRVGRVERGAGDDSARDVVCGLKDIEVNLVSALNGCPVNPPNRGVGVHQLW